jgi:outer membrane translocation and assembly module TamA
LRHLKENEYLLYKQGIKGNKKLSTESFTPLFRQETNRRLLGFLPYVSIYNFGKKFYDSTETVQDLVELKETYQTKLTAETDSAKIVKIKKKYDSKIEKTYLKLQKGNWIMRAPGEAPVIYDSALTHETVNQMKYFVFANGFFQGKASAKVDTSGKKIRVTYHILEGPEYKLNKVNYEVEDSSIANIINNSLNESTLKVNDRYSEEKISLERERLNKLMKDNGYYDFSRQFILFEIDSTEEARKVAIYAIIKKTTDGTPHRQYTIDTIIFNTDITNIPGVERDTALYRKKYYLFYKKNFSKRLLHYKTRLNPGELYSLSRVQDSQIQLASLDMYKFININFEKYKSDTSNTLRANIRTSPFKKYQISDEWGVNVGQGFIPGPFASLTFKDRNVFGGFEIFEASLRYSLEAVLAQNANPGEESKPIIMKEYGGNLSLTFPQIFFPGLGRKARYYNPKTRVLAGYNFVNRPEYTRSTLRTALNYSWQRTVNKQYNIAFIDINIVNTERLDPDFERRLDTLEANGNLLKVSFSNSIVTSLNGSYTYNNYQFGKVKRSKYWKPYFEIGGNVVNAVSKYITKEANNQFLDLQYFEFVKISSDLRYYFPVRGKSIFAIRVNAGFARPYGSSDKNGLFVLPYEKYFFTGGSSSIRAWKPRRLGPGGYKDPEGYIFEQPGEILFENNYEYRFNVFSFVDGAVFVDAGNVWNIKKDVSRPGSQFQANKFLSQIAVGTGFGIRFDFTFLILRFDIGIKAWDPGEKGSDRFVLKELIKKPPFGKKEQTVFNIGIGYPF